MLDATSDALLEAMPSGGPSSSCHETRLAAVVPRGVGCIDIATTVFSVEKAALPALRFAQGSPGSASERLRVRCFDGDLPSACIAVCGDG